jgi:hypothetical protein
VENLGQTGNVVENKGTYGHYLGVLLKTNDLYYTAVRSIRGFGSEGNGFERGRWPRLLGGFSGRM